MSLYIPKAFKNSNLTQLQAFIKQYNFSTVISSSSSIQVSHLPLVLLPDQGKYGTLVGHMAKANTHWQDFDGNHQVLCIFNGPHHYISPSWYKDKPEVPTWNYAVVHAQGAPKIITDKEELLQQMNDLISLYDPSLQDNKSDAFIPESYKEGLLSYIVGFKIEITDLVGKFKLGQNRSVADQLGMIEGLANQDGHEAQQLAQFIKQQLTSKT